jgi:hypothetical protein
MEKFLSTLYFGWGEDQMYPLPLAYDKMAHGLKLVEGKISSRVRAEETKLRQKRPRLEPERPMQQQTAQPAQQRWQNRGSTGHVEQDIRLSGWSESRMSRGGWDQRGRSGGYQQGGYGGYDSRRRGGGRF